MMKNRKNVLWKKVMAMLLAAVLVGGIFSPVTVKAGKEDSEIISLGDTISGITPNIDTFDYFYFEVPERMNISLKGYIAGSKPFYTINYDKTDGKKTTIWDTDSAWVYNRLRNRMELNSTITLKKGKYYLTLHNTPETIGKRYSFKLEGKLTSYVGISKVKKASKTSAKVSWNKVKGAKGYEVYRSTSKKGNYKKIATVRGAAYTNKKLKRHKKYYYKVRAYTTLKGRKYYTAYSSAKYVKL